MDTHNNILSDFLSLLGVPHTLDYCVGRYVSMPFKSLFGLSKTLGEYGVDTKGYSLPDKELIQSLPTPFIAVTDVGMVIVTSVTGTDISYVTRGVAEIMDRDTWLKAWDGVALCAYPTPQACEPDYTSHRRAMFLLQARDKGIVAGLVILFAYLFISNGIWQHISTILLTLFNLAGLYFTYLLVQKSLKIHNQAADAVCKVLQEGGCDSILEKKVSKLFGVFGWSEIGFTYFSVSLLTMLIFPQYLPYLALFNVCCLPYTFWSIWYQKFRAHNWCTLCVFVQSTLWCLFFCYLGGGWFDGIFPLRIEAAVLALTYLTIMLILNKTLPKFENNEK